ncbi:MAG: threonine synthase, partial [Eubacterium sp.]
MQSLSQEGTYKISSDYFAKASALFTGGYADEKATAAAIRDVFEQENYLMDPHTAVANKVYDDYVKETADTTKTIILSTASPYKFGHSVYESIFGDIPENMDDYAILEILSQKTNTEIPAPLKDLNKKTNQHHLTCDAVSMIQCIDTFLKL